MDRLKEQIRDYEARTRNIVSDINILEKTTDKQFSVLVRVFREYRTKAEMLNFLRDSLNRRASVNELLQGFMDCIEEVLALPDKLLLILKCEEDVNISIYDETLLHDIKTGPHMKDKLRHLKGIIELCKDGLVKRDAQFNDVIVSIES